MAKKGINLNLNQTEQAEELDHQREAFRSGQTVPPTPAAPEDDSLKRMTVVMRPSQADKLDAIAWGIRSKSGAKLSRSEILRALMDALIESGERLEDCTSEEDIKRRILAKLTT